MPKTPDVEKPNSGLKTPKETTEPKSVKAGPMVGIAELSATPAGRRALRRAMTKIVFFS